MTNTIEQTIVESMQAEIERLQTAGLNCAYDAQAKGMELEDYIRISDQKTVVIERLRAELAQTKVAAKEPLYDDDALNNAFLDVGFSEYAADAFSTALVDAKRMRDAYEAEIARLRATVSNTVEQYLQIQIYDGKIWHGASQRFAMTEIQQGFIVLEQWRTRFPASKFRLVSIAVTLLVPERAPEQES